MSDWSTLIAQLTKATGQDFRSIRIQPIVSKGCISETVVLENGPHRYFVKLNDPSRLEMFVAEAEGLAALAAAKSVRVPTPICWGAGSNQAYLVLEYFDLSVCGPQTQAVLGKQIAAMHRTTQAQFGWHRSNTIGSTPQVNTYSGNWAEFFRDRRLGFQLELAGGIGNYRLQTSGERLLGHIGSFFDGYAPCASLLHGDLWAGNVGATVSGEPIVFDPAVYYGDRETDVAMTELFGGFGESFYRSYNDAWPLAPGYESRKTLYNLYHVLNHLNLFGRGYLPQAERMIGQLLAQVR